MKVILFFNSCGIHEEKTINKNTFNIEDFEDFDSFKEYSNFIVLFNKESSKLNSVNLPFTKDKFNGDILLIKLNKNGKIITMPINNYLSLLNTKNSKIEEYSSDSSDEGDPLSNSCNLQLTKC
jgi:hypothetical protein